MAGQEQPDARARDVVQQLAYEDQVAERLAHLLSLVPDHRHVDPVAHIRRHAGRLGLRYFRFVVRVDQIVAAAVNVDRYAQLTAGQHGALDVPTGPSLAPWACPVRLVWQRRLPQDEVEWITLARIIGIASPLTAQREHGIPFEPAEPPVAREESRLEIDPAVAGVRESRVHESLDPVHHLRNMLGRPRG